MKMAILNFAMLWPFEWNFHKLNWIFLGKQGFKTEFRWEIWAFQNFRSWDMAILQCWSSHPSLKQKVVKILICQSDNLVCTYSKKPEEEDILPRAFWRRRCFFHLFQKVALPLMMNFYHMHFDDGLAPFLASVLMFYMCFCRLLDSPRASPS